MTHLYHSWSYSLKTLHSTSEKLAHPIFIAALLTIAKKWNQLRCPSNDELGRCGN